MNTYSDAIGEWATLDVRAQSQEQAIRAAKSAARQAGFRVADVAAATRQPESRRWHVDMRVEAR